MNDVDPSREFIADKLARIAAESEAPDLHPDDDEIPAHVVVSRPGRANSRLLQVWLNPDEYEAIERIAAERDLPMSTVARSYLLRAIQEAEERRRS